MRARSKQTQKEIYIRLMAIAVWYAEITLNVDPDSIFVARSVSVFFTKRNQLGNQERLRNS